MKTLGKVKRIDVTPDTIDMISLAGDTGKYTTVGNLYDITFHDERDNTYRITDDDGDEIWVCAEFFKTLTP